MNLHAFALLGLLAFAAAAVDIRQGEGEVRRGPPAVPAPLSPREMRYMFTRDEGYVMVAPGVALAPAAGQPLSNLTATSLDECAEACWEDARCAWLDHCDPQEGCTEQRPQCLLYASGCRLEPEVESRGQQGRTAGVPARSAAAASKAPAGFAAVAGTGVRYRDLPVCSGTTLPDCCAFGSLEQGLQACQRLTACAAVAWYASGADRCSQPAAVLLNSTSAAAPPDSFVSPEATVYNRQPSTEELAASTTVCSASSGAMGAFSPANPATVPEQLVQLAVQEAAARNLTGACAAPHGVPLQACSQVVAGTNYQLLLAISCADGADDGAATDGGSSGGGGLGGVVAVATVFQPLYSDPSPPDVTGLRVVGALGLDPPLATAPQCPAGFAAAQLGAVPPQVADAVLTRTAAAAAECAEWERPQAPTVCSKAADGSAGTEQQQWWLSFQLECVSGALAGSTAAVAATVSEPTDAAMLPRVTEFSYERAKPAGRR